MNGILEALGVQHSEPVHHSDLYTFSTLTMLRSWGFVATLCSERAKAADQVSAKHWLYKKKKTIGGMYCDFETLRPLYFFGFVIK